MNNKTFFQSIGLLVPAIAIAALAHVAKADPAASARKWRVMVIVREQHIAKPRIPDPAVETELSRILIDSSYKVVDADRIADLRYGQIMDRVFKGGPDAVREEQMLARKFGADIFVTGEAFTMVATRKTVNTDMGPVDVIQCRGRVELKAIRVDTGEKIYADANQQTGTEEPTEELSSKACLQQAAQSMGPGLLDKLNKLSFSDTQSVEIEVRGIPSMTRANEFESALAKVPGVLDVDEGDYDAHTYSTEVKVMKSLVRSLGARIESDARLKSFHLTVQSANGSKIIVNSK